MRGFVLVNILCSFSLLLGIFPHAGGTVEPSEPNPPREEEAVFELVIRNLEYPAWFTDSEHYDLPAELRKSREQGKLGLMLYFGQQDCDCCILMQDIAFARPEVIRYTQHYFNTLAVDIQADFDEGMELIDFSGRLVSEAEFAADQEVRGSPSVIFYNLRGEKMLHLTGYRSDGEFLQALDFVVGEYYHYASFGQYRDCLPERSPWISRFELNSQPFFVAPPYQLSRLAKDSTKRLAVFFEVPNCPACDLLHSRILEPGSRLGEMLGQMEVVQLDASSETPVVTPGGRRLTAREWARELEIFYYPTLIFFEFGGTPFRRVDSIAGIHNLDAILRGTRPEQRYASVKEAPFQARGGK